MIWHRHTTRGQGLPLPRSHILISQSLTNTNPWEPEFIRPPWIKWFGILAPQTVISHLQKVNIPSVNLRWPFISVEHSQHGPGQLWQSQNTQPSHLNLQIPAVVELILFQLVNYLGENWKPVIQSSGKEAERAYTLGNQNYCPNSTT